MPGNVFISTTGLPEDYCWTTPQQYAIDLAAVLEGNFVYSTLFSYGNATPPVTLQSRPWRRLNSDGTPDDWYDFVSGNWLAKHPMPTGAVIMYEGTEASIATFDGGESAAITPTTGPFWEKVSQMDGRSPIGPGTLAGGTVINVGDSLGEDEHAITISELPEHNHVVHGWMTANLSGGDNGAIINEKDADTFDANTSDTGDGEAMSLLHPVYAIWTIRRTARLYRRI